MGGQEVSELAVLQVHVDNLRDRVAALETLVSTVATKNDVQEVAESVQLVVSLMNTGTGLYRIILGLGALSAALGGMFFGFKELFKGG